MRIHYWCRFSRAPDLSSQLIRARQLSRINPEREPKAEPMAPDIQALPGHRAKRKSDESSKSSKRDVGFASNPQPQSDGGPLFRRPEACQVFLERSEAARSRPLPRLAAAAHGRTPPCLSAPSYEVDPDTFFL
jgi:hypothetical protein